ncbi:MAG: glucosamine-6-phosphate deaminase [Acidimicrobiales bacterium]
MHVVIVPSPVEGSEYVVDVMTARVTPTGPVVLGIAAGATPRLVYERFVQSGPDLREVDFVLLDEYLGLESDHGASFRHQIDTQLTTPLGIDRERVHSLDGLAVNSATECWRFESLISELGGVDWQLLGLGTNGHIAFNEPGSAHNSVTRMVELAEASRRANQRAFADLESVPRYALTQGIGTIMGAGSLLLLAFGPDKARAVRAMIEGPVTVAVPASALQLHADATVVIDRAAAALLEGVQTITSQ